MIFKKGAGGEIMKGFSVKLRPTRTLVLSVGMVALTVGASETASASIIQFDLQGRSGAGLLAGNENTAVSGAVGSGGEIGAGIFYDDVTNILTMNTGWGTANGFTNLTGNATVGHLHGPTTSAAPDSFVQNASVKYGLDSLAGWVGNAASGGFTGVVNILEADEAALLAGRFYMNVHTSTNGGGEIRGQLVIPAPGMAALLGLGGLVALRRRR